MFKFFEIPICPLTYPVRRVCYYAATINDHLMYVLSKEPVRKKKRSKVTVVTREEQKIDLVFTFSETECAAKPVTTNVYANRRLP